MKVKIFDADEPAGEGWLDPIDAFAEALVSGLIPCVIPVMIDGEVSIITVVFSPTGRVGATASCPDADTRARLALGLLDIARSRVATELGAEGVVPA